MPNTYNLSQQMRELRALFRKAKTGDAAAINSLAAANDFLAKQVNRQLRELERKGFNYGGAYNNLIYFTQTEYGQNRLKKSSQLDNDPWTIYLQMEQANKFLALKSSTVKGQEDILRNKIAKFDEMELFPKHYKLTTKKRFIRFLGNEETRSIVEEYGDSDTIIRMVREAFFSRHNTETAIRQSFMQFLANDANGAKTFDELMGSLGVDVYSKKYNQSELAKSNFQRG